MSRTSTLEAANWSSSGISPVSCEISSELGYWLTSRPGARRSGPVQPRIGHRSGERSSWRPDQSLYLLQPPSLRFQFILYHSSNHFGQIVFVADDFDSAICLL